MLSIPIMSAPIGAAASGSYGVLIWGSIGVLAVMLLGFGLLWFRRKFHPDSILNDNQPPSFSMQSIEEMRAEGIISDDEFRRLRVSLLGLDSPVVDNNNSTLSTPADVDDGTEELDSSNEPQDYKESK